MRALIRSAITCFGGLPAILGATVLRIPDVTGGEFELTASVMAGFVAAAVSGYVAVVYLLRYVRTHSLRPFAVFLLVMAPVCGVVLALK